MTAKYKTFKTQDAEHAEPYETEARQPGRSSKIIDRHTVDFKQFFEVNSKSEHQSPHRAIRAVMIKELADFDKIPGTLPIDDNNQYTSFQFQDNNGWKNFCPGHANELKMSLLKEATIVKLPAYFADTNTWRTAKTNIEIDLAQKTQQGKTKRNIRAVWVTPILQIGCFKDTSQGSAICEPVWSANGPRFRGIGPPSAARSHEEEGGNGAAASGTSAAPADAGTSAAVG